MADAAQLAAGHAAEGDLVRIDDPVRQVAVCLCLLAPAAEDTQASSTGMSTHLPAAKHACR